MTLKIICSRNIAKNLFLFINFPANISVLDVRKNICKNGAVPFLDAQELHFWSTLKANTFIFLYTSVRKFLFQRGNKILSGERVAVWEVANNFMKVDGSLGLVKCYIQSLILIEIFGNSTIFHTLSITIYHFPCVIH